MRETLAAAGLPPRGLLPETSHGGEIFEIQVQSLLRQPDLPTAFITYSRIEGGICKLACGRCGLLPRLDFSPMTSASDWATVGPSLSAILVPQQQISERAVSMLIKHVAPPYQSVPLLEIDFDFFPGATLGPFPI